MGMIMDAAEIAKKVSLISEIPSADELFWYENEAKRRGITTEEMRALQERRRALMVKAGK